jgi:hypothetical protein
LDRNRTNRLVNTIIRGGRDCLPTCLLLLGQGGRGTTTFRKSPFTGTGTSVSGMSIYTKSAFSDDTIGSTVSHGQVSMLEA